MRFSPIVVLLCAITLWALFAGAKCYEPDTRVVIFIQGVYTDLDSDGTQPSYVEEHRFDALKDAFVAAGYDDAVLLDYSYNGGTVTSRGVWRPDDYSCEDTDRPALENIAYLEQMIEDYRDEHEGAHFTLVGHSFGGYLAFLAGAREATRDNDDLLDIDVVVTLDAPLLGVSADKKIVIDLVSCEKTYESGAELVAARNNAATPALRAQQAGAMAAAGIRLATLGNANDCLYNPGPCAGGDWVDDRPTQFLPDQATLSTSYDIEAGVLQSHDAINAHPAAVSDVVSFVGAP